MSYTNTNLIAQVKNRAFLPNTANTWSNANILLIADDELKEIAAKVMSAKGDYYTVRKTLSIVSGTSRYRISRRAIGNTISDLYLDDGTNRTSLPYLSRELLEDRDGFYFENGSIVISPTPTASATAKVVFCVRPAQLIDDSTSTEFDTITNINRTTKTVTLGAAVAAGLNVSSLLCDFVQSGSGYAALDVDNEIDQIDTATLSFMDDLPESLEVGDYVCYGDKSPVPQCPDIWLPILAQRTAITMLRAQGFSVDADRMDIKLESMERAALGVIEPRTDEPRKVKGGILQGKRITWPPAR